MTDEPENHTIRLLQEMRAEMRAEFAEVRGELAKLHGETHEGFADLSLRIDGVTHILTLLAGASHDHDERIAKLERET